LKKLLLNGIAVLVLASGVPATGNAASTSCDLVNSGSFNVSSGRSTALTGFAAGETIRFTISNSDYVVAGATGIEDLTANVFVAAGTSGSFTVSPAQTAHSFAAQIVYSGEGTGRLTATCTPAPATGNSDSQNLRALQVGVTKTVATTSGAAISGAVDSAIGDAFSTTGGPPITVGPNGFTMNFAAEPQSDVARRTDEAFSALGLAGNIYNFAPDSQSQIATRTNEALSALGYAGNLYTKAPPRVYDRVWSAWADVRGTGFDQNDAPSDAHGTQLNVTAGVARRMTPDTLVGLFTGYERFNFNVEALNGKMSGNGGTVGAYAAYRFDPRWRADGMIGWSDVWYAGTAGTASGSFTGSRWLASGGLTGDYRWAALLLEPSTRIYTLWESENAWTDSLGALQPSRSFSESRVSTGGKVIYPWQATGIQILPYLGLYGDYRFSSDNALPVGVPFVGIKDGWSGRAITGVTLAAGRSGPSVSIGGELGGLGAGYDIWSASARVNWPF